MDEKTVIRNQMAVEEKARKEFCNRFLTLVCLYPSVLDTWTFLIPATGRLSDDLNYELVKLMVRYRIMDVHMEKNTGRRYLGLEHEKIRICVHHPLEHPNWITGTGHVFTTEDPWNIFPSRFNFRCELSDTLLGKMNVWRYKNI